MFKQLIKNIFLVSLCLALTSCGFRLRGEQTIPSHIRTIYFTSNNPYGEFEARLKKALTATGISLVDSAEDAPYTVQILQTGLNANTLSIGASSQATIYSVTYFVKLAIFDHKGRVLIGPQNISSTTTLTLNANQMLSSGNQIELTSQSLQRDIIVQIFALLSSDQMLHPKKL